MSFFIIKINKRRLGMLFFKFRIDDLEKVFELEFLSK